jgi:hypothetical protein
LEFDMARYRKIDPRIWNDESFRKMSMGERLGWLALLTHPIMTPMGAGVFPAGLLDDALDLDGGHCCVCPCCFSESAGSDTDTLGGGIPTYTGDGYLDRFAKADMVLRDGALVIIKNFLLYNAPDNANHLAGWIESCEELPRSGQFEVLRAHLEETGELPEWLFIGLLNPLARQDTRGLRDKLWDRVKGNDKAKPKSSSKPKKKASRQAPAEPYRDASRDGIGDGPPMTPPIQEQDQEQDQEEEKPSEQPPSSPSTSTSTPRIGDVLDNAMTASPPAGGKLLFSGSIDQLHEAKFTPPDRSHPPAMIPDRRAGELQPVLQVLQALYVELWGKDPAKVPILSGDNLARCREALTDDRAGYRSAERIEAAKAAIRGHRRTASREGSQLGKGWRSVYPIATINGKVAKNKLDWDRYAEFVEAGQSSGTKEPTESKAEIERRKREAEIERERAERDGKGRVNAADLFAAGVAEARKE